MSDLILRVVFALVVVFVPSVGFASPHGDVEQELTAAVLAQLPYPDAGAEVVSMRVMGEVPSAWTLELKAPRSWRNDVVAQLIPLSGRSRRPVRVVARIDIVVPVYVAGEGAERGEDALSSMRVERRSLRALPLHVLGPHQLEDIEGATLRTSMLSGTPLTKQALSFPRLVERGDFVTVSVTRGQVRVTGRGVAMQSGRRGDLINVKIAATDKTKQGVVRAPNLVELP
ncbi:MAG: flagellar basal body P-ring formation chaperone FlgA [Myxococcota bacterium]